MAEITIALFCRKGVWMARFSGPGAEDVVDVFGTDTIPTAYRDGMAAADVRDRIAERNPEAAVLVCQVRG